MTSPYMAFISTPPPHKYNLRSRDTITLSPPPCPPAPRKIKPTRRQSNPACEIEPYSPSAARSLNFEDLMVLRVNQGLPPY